MRAGDFSVAQPAKEQGASSPSRYAVTGGVVDIGDHQDHVRAALRWRGRSAKTWYEGGVAIE